MVRILAPLLSLRAWGTISKHITFRRRKQSVDAVKTPFPTDPKTLIQRTQRLLFQDAVAWWHDLTTEERTAYDKPGREHHMSGYAWFIRSYLLNPPAATFLSLTDTPAVYVGEAGHHPKVNATEDALEWGTIKEFPSGIVGFPGQSAASVVTGGFNAIQPNTWTGIIWYGKWFDIQNEFNLATDRFTATETGIYMVNFQVALLAVNDGKVMIVLISKNDATFRYGKTASPANFLSLSAYCPWSVSLDPGDWLEFRAWHNSLATAIIGDTAWTWATITKIA